MKVVFRLSRMGYGGAERVFLSVAQELKAQYQAEVHFVVDRIGQGSTEALVKAGGFKLFGLACTRTFSSVIPLKNHIDAYKPDILISAYTDTNLGAVISTKLAKHSCKVIVSEHASLKEHWQHAPFSRRLLVKLYIQYGYKLADHILAVSAGIASQIIEMGYSSSKVTTIHNPVRFARKSVNPIAKNNRQGVATILAVGRITMQKDYLTLLQALKLLVQKQHIKLVIVGSIHQTAEKTKLDDFIDEHNLSHYVEFAGFSEEVQQYYTNADVFVLSSAWEGFGNVIVEALAFGLPVVSTDCNHGPAEILQQGQYGKLVPVGDSEAMAEAITQVLAKNPFQRENQIARANDFSEAKIGEEYYDLFNKVAALR